MKYESPAGISRGLKIGREEFCQRLLSMLVLGEPYRELEELQPLRHDVRDEISCAPEGSALSAGTAVALAG